MSISARKLKTLYKRDLIDFFKTPAISACVIVPILFVVLYKYIFAANAGNDKTQFLLFLGMLMNSVMCSVLIPSTTIAEEKEKFTLRTLMLSNVNAMEFFLSKMLLAVTITVAGNLLIFFLAGEKTACLGPYLLVTILGNSCTIVLSAVIGILSRDQMSCSVLQMPLMFLLLLPPAFAGATKALEMLSKVTPYGAMMRLYYQITEGPFSAKKTGAALLVMAVWLVVSLILFVYFYKKKGTDN